MPRSGTLEIEFEMNPSEPSADEAASTHGVDGLLRNIAAGQTEAERRDLFDMATRDPELYLDAEMAQRLIHGVHTEYTLAMKLARLLPSVISPREAAVLVESSARTLAQREELREALAGPTHTPLFRVLVGNVTGHYRLNLQVEAHQLVARRLAQIAAREARASARGRRARARRHVEPQELLQLPERALQGRAGHALAEVVREPAVVRRAELRLRRDDARRPGAARR